MFVTGDGEAFKAILPKTKLKEKKSATVRKGVILFSSRQYHCVRSQFVVDEKNLNNVCLNVVETASSPPTDKFTMTVTDLVEREEVQDIAVGRVPLVHRAVRAVVDKKGNNFTCLQAYPNARFV